MSQYNNLAKEMRRSEMKTGRRKNNVAEATAGAWGHNNIIIIIVADERNKTFITAQSIGTREYVSLVRQATDPYAPRDPDTRLRR